MTEPIDFDGFFDELKKRRGSKSEVEAQPEPLNDLLCNAEILADRREKLCKKPPTCPDCKTDQVQLTEWIEGEVAEWKCRHCRTRFKFERGA